LRLGLYYPKGGLMRRYETFIILDPDLSEEGRTPVIKRVEEIITEHNGLLVQVDEWGNRKLAYEVKKKARGYYVRFDFCGDATLVNEMERFFRINDSVMKFMTVLLDKEIDLEKVKEEAAAIEAEKKRSKETAKKASSESKTPDVAESKATDVEAETPGAADSEAKEAEAETPDTAATEATKVEAETPGAADSEATEAEAATPDTAATEATKVEAETPDAADSEATKAEAATPDTAAAEATEVEAETPEETQKQTPEVTDEEKK